MCIADALHLPDLTEPLSQQSLNVRPNVSTKEQSNSASTFMQLSSNDTVSAM